MSIIVIIIGMGLMYFLGYSHHKLKSLKKLSNVLGAMDARTPDINNDFDFGYMMAIIDVVDLIEKENLL